MRNIVIENLNHIPVDLQKIEIVERKGLGHPDYIADSLGENFSHELSKEYERRFGVILHHNVDKLDIVGGQSDPDWGAGKILVPILIFFSGRATNTIENEIIPVKDIAIKSAKDWLKKHMRFIDTEKYIRYQVETKNGSADLRDIYERKTTKIIGANDTSLGSGYAPLTETEQIVLNIEKFLNSTNFKKRYQAVGEDIKIIGMMNGNDLNLTISSAMLSKYINNIKEYISLKQSVIGELQEYIQSIEHKNRIEFYLNTNDDPNRGKSGCYLTVTGTSLEQGDDGAVGRGNRVNGIIPYNRPVSMEAAAGKNPVNHVGKIYNVLAFKIANQIYQNISGIKEVYIQLLSQIGTPIDQPFMASIRLTLKPDKSLMSIEPDIKSIIDDELSKIANLTNLLINDEISVC